MDLNFFKRQLASVIEWTNQQANVLLFKYPSDKDEIKNASKLIVGPGQGVVLVYEGNVTDVLPEPGIYNLGTDNHPFITTLLKLRTAFESEHKMKIYFYRTSENTDQNWGTATSIKYVDPVYQFPVALGANGNFSFQLSDPERFFTHIVTARIDLVSPVPHLSLYMLERSRLSPSLRPRRHIGSRVHQAREDARHLGNFVLRISGNGVAFAVNLRRAVEVELDEANSEKLHDLARVVLVGPRGFVKKAGLGVAGIAEKIAHDRVIGHVGEDGVEIGESVPVEQIIPVAHALAVLFQGVVLVAGDKNLAQRVGDLPPKLVVAVADHQAGADLRRLTGMAMVARRRR